MDRKAEYKYFKQNKTTPSWDIPQKAAAIFPCAKPLNLSEMLSTTENTFVAMLLTCSVLLSSCSKCFRSFDSCILFYKGHSGGTWLWMSQTSSPSRTAWSTLTSRGSLRFQTGIFISALPRDWTWDHLHTKQVVFQWAIAPFYELHPPMISVALSILFSFYSGWYLRGCFV